MKLIAQDNIKKKIWEVGIEPIDTYGAIPASIGLMKGDLIVFAGEGDYRRFSPGRAAGKILITDPTSELGWVLGESGGLPSTQLKNVSGGQVIAGRVLRLTYTSNTPSFVLATVTGTAPLFIAAEDSSDGHLASCYGVPGTIVPVMINGTINRGDGVKVTAKGYGGKAENSPGAIGIALEKKTTSGNDLVKVLLTGTGGRPAGTEGDSDDVGDDRVVAWTGRAITVKNDYEFRNDAGRIGGLEITLPNEPNPLFHCTVSFNASGAFEGITFKKGSTAYSVKNVGHELDKKSVRYNLAIWWDGAFYWCSTKAQ